MESKDKEPLIDEWLDNALRQRGAVGPRPGLENRILAAVTAERDRVPAHNWSWRPVWVTFAAILLVAMVASLRKTATKIGPTSAASNVAAPVVSKSPQHGATSTTVRRKSHASGARAVSVPRLEKFPSPQPLSEQEQILARYIQQFPREAVLVAQAQTEPSKQEMIEQETSSSTERNP